MNSGDATCDDDKMDAFAAAAAELIGLTLDQDERVPVVAHLKIAAKMAALIDAAHVEDEDEPASVYSL